LCHDSSVYADLMKRIDRVSIDLPASLAWLADAPVPTLLQALRMAVARATRATPAAAIRRGVMLGSGIHRNKL